MVQFSEACHEGGFDSRIRSLQRIAHGRCAVKGMGQYQNRQMRSSALSGLGVLDGLAAREAPKEARMGRRGERLAGRSRYVAA